MQEEISKMGQAMQDMGKHKKNKRSKCRKRERIRELENQVKQL